MGHSFGFFQFGMICAYLSAAMDGQGINISKFCAAGAAILLACCLATPLYGQSEDFPSSAPTTQSAESSESTTMPEPSTPLVLAGGDTGKDWQKEQKSPLWQMAASAVVILVIGGVGLFVVRRYLPRMKFTSQSRQVSLLETTTLGQRQTVHLLKVGTKKILVSGGTGGVNFICEVKEDYKPDNSGNRSDR